MTGEETAATEETAAEEMAAKETADEEMAKAAADVAEEAAAEEMETEMAAEETAAEETAAEETEAEEMAADETATKGTATEDMAAESAEEDTAVEMAVVELAAVASTIDEFAKIAEAATSRFRLPAARLAAPLGCVRFCWRPVRSCLRPVRSWLRPLRSWLRPLRSRWSCRLTKVTAFPRSLIEAKRAGRLWEEEELGRRGRRSCPHACAMHINFGRSPQTTAALPRVAAPSGDVRETPPSAQAPWIP